MRRREFFLTTGAAELAGAAPAPVTVLYGDRSVAVDHIRPDPKDLWVRAADLPRINEFELKPEGACRADMCIPVSKNLKSGEWFNLTGFAQKLGETVVADSGVWSFGEIPVVRAGFYN